MTAPLIELADAVTQRLNVPGLPLAFTARRDYLTVFAPETLGELDYLTVKVQPMMLTGQQVSRAAEVVDYQVAVSVQQRVDAEDLTATDGLMGLVQAVIDRFFPGKGALAGFTCIGYQNEPAYSEEDLGTKGLFTSIVNLQFRRVR